MAAIRKPAYTKKQELDRTVLINQILTADTPEEMKAASENLRMWLGKYPSDYALRQVGSNLTQRISLSRA